MMALLETEGCQLNQSTTCGRIATKPCFLGRSDSFRRTHPEDGEHPSSEGLPRAFLLSLRTLFDILDDGRRGYVHISEIESRWQGADTRDLPGGVLGCLRRVAPPHGLLSFDRFVAGLRCSMLNPDNDQYHLNQAPPQTTRLYPKQHQQHPQRTKPASHSTCNVGTRMENKVRPLGPSNVTNTQQPQHRGPPLQSGPGDGTGVTACGTARHKAGHGRAGRSLERVSVQYVEKQTAPQPGRVRPIDSLAVESALLQRSRPSAVEAGLPRSQSESATGFRAGSRRHGRSREGQRRHTITNGVDYGMLKQMKELEQEKDSLLAGLELLERAWDWYQTQIHSVTERQCLLGQNQNCPELFSEGNQSHFNVLIPKMQEVNCCLTDLMSCTGTNPFPPPGGQTSTQAPSTQPSSTQAPSTQAPPQAIQRLKEQNRLLTQEVTEKSDRITQLEQEKSALIKQLFEARARSAHDTSTMDSTFI